MADKIDVNPLDSELIAKTNQFNTLFYKETKTASDITALNILFGELVNYIPTASEINAITAALDSLSSSVTSHGDRLDIVEVAASDNESDIDSNLGLINSNLGLININQNNLNISRTAKDTTGSANAYLVDTDGTFDLTKDGNILPLNPNFTNTGTSTINPDGQGVKNIKKWDADTTAYMDLEADDIKQNEHVFFRWNLSEGFFVLAPKNGGGVEPIEIISATLQKDMSKDERVIVTADMTTLTKLATVTGSPSGDPYSVAWDSTDEYVAFGFNSTQPLFTIYRRSNDTFTELTVPSVTGTSRGYGVAWFTYDGLPHLIVVDASTTPTVYEVDGNTVTQVSVTGLTLSINGLSCAITKDEKYLLVTMDGSPKAEIFKIDGLTFTKVSNPSTLPSYNENCDWSEDGRYLYISGPLYYEMYEFIDGAWGSRYFKANYVSNNIACGGYSGSRIADCTNGNGVYIDERIIGNTFNNIGIPETGQILGVSWFSNNYVAYSDVTMPYLKVSKINYNRTFTTLSISGTPTNFSRAMSFSNSGQYLAMGVSTTPYANFYKTDIEYKAYLGGDIAQGGYGTGILKENGTSGQVKEINIINKA